MFVLIMSKYKKKMRIMYCFNCHFLLKIQVKSYLTNFMYLSFLYL